MNVRGMHRESYVEWPIVKNEDQVPTTEGLESSDRFPRKKYLHVPYLYFCEDDNLPNYLNSKQATT